MGGDDWKGNGGEQGDPTAAGSSGTYEGEPVKVVEKSDLERFVGKSFTEVQRLVYADPKYNEYKFPDAGYLSHLREDHTRIPTGLQNAKGSNKFNIVAFSTPKKGEEGKPGILRWKLSEGNDDSLDSRVDTVETKPVDETFDREDVIILVKGMR